MSLFYDMMEEQSQLEIKIAKLEDRNKELLEIITNLLYMKDFDDRLEYLQDNGLCLNYIKETYDK